MSKLILLFLIFICLLVNTQAFAQQTRSEQYGNYTYHYNRNGTYIGTSSKSGNVIHNNMIEAATGSAIQTRAVRKGHVTYYYEGNGTYKGSTTASSQNGNKFRSGGYSVSSD